MSLGFTVKFFGTIMDLLLPYILAHILDYVTPTKDILAVMLWGAVMIVAAGAAYVMNVCANRMASKVARDTVEVIRHDLFSKTIALSRKQADTFTVPSLVSRLTSDTFNINQMLAMIQRLGVRAPLLLVGGIAVSFVMEPVLSLALIGMVPLIGLVVYLVSSKGIPLFTKVREAGDQLVRTIQENVTGIRVIRALSKGEYERERFGKVNSDLASKEKRSSLVMTITSPSINLLLNLAIAIVIVIGAYRVNSGAILPGKIIAFLSYFTIISNATMMVSRMFMMYSKGSASAKRIAEVLDTDTELMLTEPDHVDDGYHISFDHVSFSYNKRRSNLTDVSFGLKKGQTLGIIGATGSGKTTIVNLLLRFYDADIGTVRISGDDVRSIHPDELYKKFGIAFQDDFLISDTIKENIDLGRKIDDEAIRKAADDAQAVEFINSRDEGYNFKLAVKGQNLSGGQKQRLLISRALAGEPEIIILDDSSNALDYRTDADLRRALGSGYRDSTFVIVTQRISTLKNSDLILVIDDGKIIGKGTHDELLESCKEYRDTYEMQMGEEMAV